MKELVPESTIFMNFEAHKYYKICVPEGYVIYKLDDKFNGVLIGGKPWPSVFSSTYDFKFGHVAIRHSARRHKCKYKIYELDKDDLFLELL